jgi:hypothetical protein
MVPTAHNFRVTLRARMQGAEHTSENTVEVNSGRLHREVGGYPAQKPSDAGMLRGDEIRNERGGCDPTGASKEAGRFAYDPLQASPLLMGTIMPKGPRC